MIERTYIIPLRRQVVKSPKYKRAKKAVNTVRIFLSKHMKSDDVKIGNVLNNLLWERGIKNPPGKVKITVTKDDKGVVKAELFGHKYVEKKKAEAKVEKSKLEQLKEKMSGAKEEPTKDQIENKEAITDVPEHKHHDHTAKDHNKELKSVDEKDMKTSSGKQKAQDKKRN
jgi:large subunit ribosomal protein L31e